MHLLITMPLVLFLSLWFYFFTNHKNLFLTRLSLRSSMLAGVCFSALSISFSTEVLSLLNALNFKGLVFFYVVAIGTIWIVILATRSNNYPLGYNFKRPRLSRVDYILGLFLLLFFLTQAIISYVFPPNNWDSMTYHLPRVMHWMQNQSVAHYASHNPWQLLYPPFAEFAILHTYILTDSDYFAQSIQWVAMVGSCVGVSLIVRELGSSVRLQLWSSILAATIPMGIYEAVSTQNDYVLTLWVVAATYYFLTFIGNQSASAAIMVAISIGLAIKTKGTAYIFLAPVVLLYLGLILKRKNITLIKLGILIAVMAVGINASNFIRNTDLYGDPIGLSVGKSAATPAFRVATLYSNAWRHLAYNMASESKEVNNFITSVTVGMHRIFGLDVADPQISADKYFFIPYGRLLYSENYAPSPFHLFYFLLSLVVFYLVREKVNSRVYVLFFILLAGFVLFCSYLKWQFFAGRLLLPVLVLSTAFTAIVWDQALRSTHKRWVNFTFFALLSMPAYQSTVHIARAVEKPLTGEKNLFNTPREQLYFVERPGLQQSYQDLTNRLTANPNCNRIGLVLGTDEWEYPLWVMLRQREKKFVIHHTNVKNVSGQLEKSAGTPCLIVELNNTKNVARIK